jgi:hypothetical protein
MSDELLNSLLTRWENVSLLEWAKRGWVKDVERLTPYFIAYLCFPFDLHKQGTEAYGMQNEKCLMLQEVLYNNAMGYADWTYFDSVKWPFKLPDCPELRLMSEEEYEGYLQGRLFPGIRTYIYPKSGFMDMLTDRGISAEVFGADSLLWRWLKDFYEPPRKLANKIPSITDDAPGSIYRMLLGMAIDAYGFTPNVPKQENGVMKKISASMERAQLGTMDAATILKHLRAAVEKTSWKPHKS